MAADWTRDDPKVAVWQVEDFNNLFGDALLGDQWTSDPFAFAHPKLGRVDFHLHFHPKDAVSNLPSLYMHMNDDLQDVLIRSNCVAWLEDENGVQTTPKKEVLHLNAIRSEGWKPLLTPEEMEAFRNIRTVFIVCKLPYEVFRIGIPAAISTLQRWRIADFSTRFQLVDFMSEWKSEPFEVEGFENVKFVISFYPKGHLESKNNRCGLYLRIEDFANYSTVHVQYELWMEKNSRKRTMKTACNDVYSRVGGYGWSSFMDQEELNKLIGKCQLCICCNVRPIVPIEQPQFSTSQTADSEVSNVGIRLGDSVSNISSSLSEDQLAVFRELFTKTAAQTNSTIADLEDKILHAFLVFLYTNQLDQTMAVELLPIGILFNITNLIDSCTNSIVEKLDVKNVFRDLEFAFAQNQTPTFQRRVIDFARQNCMEIVEMSEWEEFTANNPKILTALLKSFF